MKWLIIMFGMALAACGGASVDGQALGQCWRTTDAARGMVTLAAHGVFVPRHGAVLVSDTCAARLSVSGDAAYQRLDALSPSKLSTAPIPFAATFVGTLNRLRGPNGEILVKRVDALSELSGPGAANLMTKWDAVD